jgi:membrane fusion protein, multidrug efflux system
MPPRASWAVLTALVLYACKAEAPPAPQARPVRTIAVRLANAGEPVTLTGHIRARNEVNLAFRLDGRLTERSVSVGDAVRPGMVVARLESQDEQNALRSAQAEVAAAQAALVEARNAEARQRTLLAQGISARAQYDAAEQQHEAARSRLESAEARLQGARDTLGYTTLRADVRGAVTATGAEPGEVVRAGQMIVRVAQRGGKDGVFNVPAQIIRAEPKPPVVTVRLADDPRIATTGRVREVSPQADPVTGTYLVKVGLDKAPDTMRLGATVTGTVTTSAQPVIQVPATALTRTEGKPAVWVVDAATRSVSLREVAVAQYDATTVIVTDGLKEGEVVVTAGVQALRPGQEVRLLDGTASGSR